MKKSSIDEGGRISYAALIFYVLATGILVWEAEGLLQWIGVVFLFAAGGVWGVLARQDRESTEVLGGIVAALQQDDSGQVDLSFVIPEQGSAYVRQLARVLNSFVSQLRDSLQGQQDHSLKIGFAAARGRLLTERASIDASQQEEVSELVFRSSNEATTAVAEVSKRTNTIADVNSRNLDAARSSLVELQDVSEHIDDVASIIRGFQETVGTLVSSSSDIRSILETVQGFAAQTNLLALNAAIEAARAGEHGRGFAVVADEVRDLATKVRAATEQISSMVEAMSGAVSVTADGTGSVLQQAEQARTAVVESASKFQGMVQDFEASHADLLMVGSALEELSATNQEGHQRSLEIRDLGSHIRQSMEASFTHADTQRDITDLTLQELCRFRIGRGEFEPIVDTLLAHRDAIQADMEQLAAQGVNIFDQNYVPHPQSAEHFTVGYLEALRQVSQGKIDDWSRQHRERILFWSPVDERGYMPLARSEISQQPTGDPVVDLANSQAMRFARVSEAELENLRNCKHFSLMSYAIGSERVVFALYAPLTVRGRRWGTLTAGILPQVFGLE